MSKKSKKEALEKKECMDMLKYWKEQLGLSNWFIQLNTNVPDMGGWGDVVYEVVHSAAVINIAKKTDGSYVTKYDAEVILVHELLHIKFSLIENTFKKVAYDVYHQSLEDIAVALVLSKRGVSRSDIGNY